VKAVRFAVGGGEPRLGRLDDGHVVDAGEAGPRGFDASDEAWATLASAGGVEHALDDVRLLPPVVPQKILAVGLNYQTHVEETSLQRPDVPFCFAIFPSSLTGPYDEIVVPAEETRPDWEGEVAVLLGRRTYRADRAAARAAIGGLAALNDVSGRRAQLETPMRQFTLGKSFDTFTPLGPCVVHPDDLDLGAIVVSTRIDGELMQSSDTSHLIFGFEELIEYFSKGVTLEPGDVIATGTPGGVGDERKPPRYLREGEVVEVAVEGVGSLQNPVRFERL
jgi:2-keto-4-pentenoate hydratase/2-oxohepta-3-ene-1,7-dioic acid hydratase in catechol pathway